MTEKLNESKCFPLFTQQRTSPRYFGMSVSCHKRTHALQQRTSLLDHLVGAAEQRDWEGEAKRLSHIEIEDQLDFRRLLDRQFGRLGTLEDLLTAAFRPPSRKDA